MEKDEVKQLFSRLACKQSSLTLNQWQFVQSVNKYWRTTGRITDAQLHILSEIYRYAIPVRTVKNNVVK